jgi:hypothetical protein
MKAILVPVQPAGLKQSEYAMNHIVNDNAWKTFCLVCVKKKNNAMAELNRVPMCTKCFSKHLERIIKLGMN